MIHRKLKSLLLLFAITPLLVSLIPSSLVSAEPSPKSYDIPKVNITADATTWTTNTRINSTIYERALYNCMLPALENSEKKATNYFLSTSSATSLNGWYDAGLLNGSAAIIPSSDASGDGVLSCNNENGWIDKALSLWKINTKIEALCTFGWYRDTTPDNSDLPIAKQPGTYNDCVNGKGGVFRNTYSPGSAEVKVTTSPQEFLYRLNYARGIDVTLSGGDTYMYYRKIFEAPSVGCTATQLVKLSEASADQKQVLETNKGVQLTIIDGTKLKGEPAQYIYQLEKKVITDTVKLSNYITNKPLANSDSPSNDGGNSCKYISEIINKYAVQYLNSVNQGTSDPGADQTNICDSDASGVGCGSGGTSCVIDQVGWMVCPIMGAIGGLADGMYGWISSVLILNPLESTDASGGQSAQYQIWQRVRDVANILLVIAFLLIIFSQITSIGVSNYGVKKLLPRVIIVAIAINLSYIVMQLSIDAVNLIGVGLKTLLETSAVTLNADTLDAGQLVGSLLTGTFATGAAVAGGVAIASLAGLSAGALALLAFPFILVAVLGLFAAVATLFVRNALVIVLVIAAPVAFAAYLLPNTESLFKKWRQLFISTLMLFPMAALVFAGAKLAAFAVVSSNQPLSAIIGVFIMAAPLGSLPFLIKSSNNVLAGVGGRLQKIAQSAKNPLQKALKPAVEQQKAEYQAGQRGFLGRRFGANKIERRAAAGKRNMAEKFNEHNMNVDQETKNSQQQAKNNYQTRAGATTPTAPGAPQTSAQRAAAALDTAGTAGKESAANDERFKERLAGRTATAGSLESRLNERLEDAKTGGDRYSEVIKTQGLERIRNNDASTTTGEGLLDIRKEAEATKLDTGKVEAQLDQVFKEEVANDPTLMSVAVDTERAKLGSAVAQGEVDLQVQRDKGVGGASLTQEMKRRALAEQTDASTKRTDQMQTELGTDSTAKYLNLAGTENRASLQNSREKLNVTASATERAQRIAQQEYADNVRTNPSLAERAAGIDTVHGTALVDAQAYETQRAAYDKNVAAYTVRLKEQGTPDSVVPLTGIPDKAGDDSFIGKAMDTTLTPEEREAAGRAITAAGNIDAIKPYQDYLANALVAARASGDANEIQTVQSLQKAYGDTVSNSPGKPMGLGAADIANFKTGEYTIPTAIQPIPSPVSPLSPSDIQTLNTVTEKGVSMDNWAAMDKSDINTIINLAAVGAVPKDRLDAMKKTLTTTLTDPRWSGRIKEREQKLLEQLRDAIK